jgi:hypothetical protein
MEQHLKEKLIVSYDGLKGAGNEEWGGTGHLSS